MSLPRRSPVPGLIAWTPDSAEHEVAAVREETFAVERPRKLVTCELINASGSHFIPVGPNILSVLFQRGLATLPRQPETTVYSHSLLHQNAGPKGNVFLSFASVAQRRSS